MVGATDGASEAIPVGAALAPGFVLVPQVPHVLGQASLATVPLIPILLQAVVSPFRWSEAVRILNCMGEWK